MDEVHINKYLSQFNPILIVPVLSAVVGAILVFLFGFKRPNEPRFQSNSAIDQLKKPKRKVNATITVLSSKQTVISSGKIGFSKKAAGVSVAIASKKGSVNEKSSNNNNNVSSNNNNNNNNNNINKKKSENGSPSKKIVNKRASKEPENAINKTTKINKNKFSEEYDKKPADFDDGNWFTVQSKSAKQKIKVDDSTGNQNYNQSQKVQNVKNNKSAKSVKVDVKQSVVQVSFHELNSNMEAEHSNTEKKFNDISPDFALASEVTTQANPVKASVFANSTVELNVIDSEIVFDELGEWTNAKPDRKRGNKKKSRKD